MRDALIGRQAFRALPGAGSTAVELDPFRSTELQLRDIEAFNIQLEITDFASSFDELELEYEGLKADDELNHPI